jgi:hypothetical protein
MLRIVTKDGKKHQWEIGDDPKPEIHADGNEFYFIQQNFKNLPTNFTATTQWWFGDMAAFIFANLEGYWQPVGGPQRAVLKKGTT